STVSQDGDESAKVGTPGAADVSPPHIDDVHASKDNGTDGKINSGDVHDFSFDEVMNASTGQNGSTYRISDGDGTQADIICGTNATCSFTAQAPPDFMNPTGPPHSTMSVTLQNPTVVSPGGDNTLTY